MAPLGLGRLLFGAPPAAGTKKATPPPEAGDGEPTTSTVKQHVGNDQGAAAGQSRTAGEHKQMVDEVRGVRNMAPSRLLFVILVIG